MYACKTLKRNRFSLRLIRVKPRSGGQGFHQLWGRFSQRTGFSLALKPRKSRVFKGAHGLGKQKALANTIFTAGSIPDHLRLILCNRRRPAE